MALTAINPSMFCVHHSFCLLLLLIFTSFNLSSFIFDACVASVATWATICRRGNQVISTRAPSSLLHYYYYYFFFPFSLAICFAQIERQLPPAKRFTFILRLPGKIAQLPTAENAYRRPLAHQQKQKQYQRRKQKLEMEKRNGNGSNHLLLNSI